MAAVFSPNLVTAYAAAPYPALPYAAAPYVVPPRSTPLTLVPPSLVPPPLVPPPLVPPGRGLPGPVPTGVLRPVPRRHAAAVYRRRRVAVLLVVALLIVGAWLIVRSLAGGAPATVAPVGRPTVAHVWVVRPGDTLWSIALASGDKGDIRPLVDRFSDQVHGQPLQVGEWITLP